MTVLTNQPFAIIFQFPADGKVDVTKEWVPETLHSAKQANNVRLAYANFILRYYLKSKPLYSPPEARDRLDLSIPEAFKVEINGVMAHLKSTFGIITVGPEERFSLERDLQSLQGLTALYGFGGIAWEALLPDSYTIRCVVCTKKFEREEYLPSYICPHCGELFST